MNTGFNLMHLLEVLNEIGDLDAPIFPHTDNYTKVSNGYTTSFKDDLDNSINIEIIQVNPGALPFVREEKIYNMSFDVNGKEVKDQDSLPYGAVLKLIRTTVVIAFEFISKYKPNGLLISAYAGDPRKTKILNSLYHSYISSNKSEGYTWQLMHVGALPIYFIHKEEPVSKKSDKEISEMCKQIFKESYGR